MLPIMRIAFISLFLTLNLFFLISCNAGNMSHSFNTEVPHLFVYDKGEILNYLKKHGYSGFRPNEIKRDSMGTTLFIYGYSDDKSDKIFSVSKAGKIKMLVPPAINTFMDDNGEFIAWSQNIGEGINFKNGKFRSLSFFDNFHIALGGQFFSISRTFGIEIINHQTVQVEPIKHFTKIASTEDPDKVLYSTTLGVDDIFFKDNKIYLFTRPHCNFKYPGNYEECEIICQILKKSDDDYKLDEEIHIPRPKPSPSPFAVIDLDPWSDNVLLVDVVDPPFSFLTSWYVFDLKTKKLTKIGRSKDYGFFLKEDILGVLE